MLVGGGFDFKYLLDENFIILKHGFSGSVITLTDEMLQEAPEPFIFVHVRRRRNLEEEEAPETQQDGGGAQWGKSMWWGFGDPTLRHRVVCMPLCD